MRLCDGWDRSKRAFLDWLKGKPNECGAEGRHQIFILGCRVCGGIDCDDTGDVIYLCDACLAKLKEDSGMMRRFEIWQDEELDL